MLRKLDKCSGAATYENIMTLRKGGMNVHWSDKYPHMLYVSVLLLDNKIENWKVGNRKWSNPYEISGYWKIGRMKDYKVQWIGYLCRNEEEHAKVFEELAPKWLKQWKHAKDYFLSKAY